MKSSSHNGPCALDVLSPEAFDAALLERAKAITPEQPPLSRTIDRLVPHRATLLELRKQGYSLAQIVALLKDPQFGIDISVSSIRRLLDRKPRTHKAAPPTVKHQPAPAVSE